MATVATAVKRSYDDFRGNKSPFEPERSFRRSHPSRGASVERLSTPSTTPGPHALGATPLVQSEPNSRIGSPIPYQRFAKPTVLRASRVFVHDASILIIGIRGTGKSSLAVIASKALRRPIIDADDFFAHFSGSSRTEYRKQHGAVNYRKQEARVMHTLLAKYQTGYIIACGPSGSVDGSGDDPLKEFAKEHPVIYLVRDQASVGQYLDIGDDGKIRRLLDICGPFYRSSSNFEFYNIGEAVTKHARSVNSDSDASRFSPMTPFLTLKDVEQDFLRLLRHISHGTASSLNADVTFPLSSVPLESRDYTYAVIVPLSRLMEEDLDIEDLAVGADAFELCIDNVDLIDSSLSPSFVDSISRQFARVRRHTLVPVIFNVDPRAMDRVKSVSHGKDDMSRKLYLDLVHHGLRLGSEYVTIDLSIADNEIDEVFASKGYSKIIGDAHHDAELAFDWDSETPLQLYLRAQNLGCDVVRLSKPAASDSDNYGVQRFRHRLTTLPYAQSRPPVIAYNTGNSGRMSCCFNRLLTPVTHANLRNVQVPGFAPDMITVAEAQEALFKVFALDKLQFYIFGGNINHSFSPALHNAAFDACGMPHRYSICQSSTLRPLIDLIGRSDFGGCAVSLPYKLEVMALVNSLSPSAKAIGAINTLVPVREGCKTERLDDESSLHCGRNRAGRVQALHGHNTDWIGILNTVLGGLSPVNAVGPKSTGLITGAGGMARAAVYSLMQLGVKHIFIHNRTTANAEKIAQHFNGQGSGTNVESSNTADSGPSTKATVTVLRTWTEEWPAGYAQPTIIVSTVPSASQVGGPPPNFTLPEQWLESTTGGVVVELAYKPLVTPLMRQMRAGTYITRGYVFLDGLNVLPQQSFAQFEVFTGRRAPRRLMKAAVLRAYRQSQSDVDDEAGVVQRLEDMESPAAI